ncbi:MAG: PAS domain-containing protein [Alphaproteobacteria bacterium]
MGIQTRAVIPEGIEPVARSLFEYWSRVRGGKIVPGRSDIRPADILPLLPYLIILEYHPDGTLIHRLVGTACVERLGADYTGVNLFDQVAAHNLRHAAQNFNVLRCNPCGMIVHKKIQPEKRTPFVAQILYLPLRDRSGEISQLIGSVSALGMRDGAAGSADINHPAPAQFLDIGAGLPQPGISEARRAT